MKKTIFLCLLLIVSINTASSATQTRPLPTAGVHLVDILIYRPGGLVATIAGTALFIGISPLTALAAISPPHDAFEKTAGFLIVAPAKFTFDRPLGTYYPDPDGEYRRTAPMSTRVDQRLPVPPPPPEANCSTHDDDHDGVDNCHDKCPGSLAGIVVTQYGCWVVDVKFDNDSDLIKPEYYVNLDNVAKAIRNHPEVTIEIQGHTSQTGSYEHNMTLSERRAKAVENYLKYGHQLPNISSRGYGWTRPIDTNQTEQGRANNRRVQLEVNGKLQSTTH